MKLEPAPEKRLLKYKTSTLIRKKTITFVPITFTYIESVCESSKQDISSR